MTKSSLKEQYDNRDVQSEIFDLINKLKYIPKGVDWIQLEQLIYDIMHSNFMRSTGNYEITGLFDFKTWPIVTGGFPYNPTGREVVTQNVVDTVKQDLTRLIVELQQQHNKDFNSVLKISRDGGDYQILQYITGPIHFKDYSVSFDRLPTYHGVPFALHSEIQDVVTIKDDQAILGSKTFTSKTTFLGETQFNTNINATGGIQKFSKGVAIGSYVRETLEYQFPNPEYRHNDTGQAIEVATASFVDYYYFNRHAVTGDSQITVTKPWRFDVRPYFHDDQGNNSHFVDELSIIKTLQDKLYFTSLVPDQADGKFPRIMFSSEQYGMWATGAPRMYSYPIKRKWNEPHAFSHYPITTYVSGGDNVPGACTSLMCRRALANQSIIDVIGLGYNYTIEGTYRTSYTSVGRVEGESDGGDPHYIMVDWRPIGLLTSYTNNTAGDDPTTESIVNYFYHPVEDTQPLQYVPLSKFSGLRSSYKPKDVDGLLITSINQMIGGIQGPSGQYTHYDKETDQPRYSALRSLHELVEDEENIGARPRHNPYSYDHVTALGSLEMNDLGFWTFDDQDIAKDIKAFKDTSISHSILYDSFYSEIQSYDFNEDENDEDLIIRYAAGMIHMYDSNRPLKVDQTFKNSRLQIKGVPSYIKLHPYIKNNKYSVTYDINELLHSFVVKYPSAVVNGKYFEGSLVDNTGFSSHKKFTFDASEITPHYDMDDEIFIGHIDEANDTKHKIAGFRSFSASIKRTVDLPMTDKGYLENWDTNKTYISIGDITCNTKAGTPGIYDKSTGKPILGMRNNKPVSNIIFALMDFSGESKECVGNKARIQLLNTVVDGGGVVGQYVFQATDSKRVMLKLFQGQKKKQEIVKNLQIFNGQRRK